MHDLLVKGGFILWVIIAFSIAAIAVSIERLYYISYTEKVNFVTVREHVIKLIHANKVNDAVNYCKELQDSFSQSIFKILRNKQLSTAVLKDKIDENLIELSVKLERNLWFISLTIQLAPVLGLLGTVTGMIKVFNVISMEGMGDPAILSTGISEALITTAAGLFLFVPLSLAHAYLVRKVDEMLAEVEITSLELVHTIKGD